MNDEATLNRVCMLMAVLVEEIRGLRGDLSGRAQAAPRTLAESDTAALTVLLPAILAAISGPFTVRQMIERAGEGTQDAHALRGALASLAIGDNARLIGRLLRRAAVSGVEIAENIYVDAVGSSRAGAVWRVVTETRETRMARCIAARLGGRIAL